MLCKAGMPYSESVEMALKVGSSARIELPRIVPREVDRAWGHVVLAKAEFIDVTPTADRKGLRPVDAGHDLPENARDDRVARAFEFQDDWKLVVKVTRYAPKDVRATSIERALVRMVLTRGDVTSVQAIYRLRSARQRLVVRLPENAGFDALQKKALTANPDLINIYLNFA